MKQGMTLIELLLALVVVGLLTGAAAPAVAGLRDRHVVQAAAAEIAGAHNRARIRAVLESRVSELEVRADSLVISLTFASGAAVVWSVPGPLASGTALLSPSRKISFAPTGVTMGFANATFIVTRGSARRQVVVSRLGRVRVIP